MKRLLSLLFALTILLTVLSGCAAPAEPPVAGAEKSPAPAEAPAPAPVEAPVQEDGPKTVSFTDSLGRTVEIPADVKKIAVSGPMAQLTLFALAPHKLAGVANAWDPIAEQYLDPKYSDLPQLGQLYGGKGEMNLETLLNSGAEVIIDVGEPKDSAKDDLDALQAQAGIPFVHISASISTMGDAYRKLGALLGMPEEAEALAVYCEDVYAKMHSLVGSVTKVKALYCLGDTGENIIAKGSYHGEIMDFMCDNAAVVEAPTSKGTGNEVDMEQLLLWNPDVIIFAPESVYGLVGSDPQWQNLTAIKSGAYYEVPNGPYNWMGFPPGVQRYLGMLWMGKLLYPDAAQYDLFEETAAYFDLFYHTTLSREQFEALTANSIGKAQK